MKSLILYTTKYGCTEKVATLLKAHMSGETTLVNLRKQPALSLADYDVVLIGGSIYYGRIQKELTAFVHASLPELMKKKVGLFICAGSPDPAVRIQELRSAFPEALYEHAVCKEILGSAVDFAKLSLLERFIYRMASGVKVSQSDIPGDSIHHFAEAVLA